MLASFSKLYYTNVVKVCFVGLIDRKERMPTDFGLADCMGLFEKLFGTYSERELKHVYPLADEVLALEEKYAKMSDSTLCEQTDLLKKRLANAETLDDILPDAFAVCREAAWRVLGLKHFRVQIIGGIILHQGRIAEMRTGEGKTLMATLAAYLNALTGKGVHIVTVNDYLAKRDSEWMGKVYRYLGLSVGLVIHGMTNVEKQAAYNADITYGTNNEFGFDYLRDNMVTYKKQRVQRPFNFAIVDEVDSILIDEARTPLIISGHGDNSTELYTIVDAFAKQLKAYRVVEVDKKEEQDDIDGDYIVDEKGKTATLTPRGVKKAEEFFKIENLMAADNINLLHHINQAIKAYGIMQRDVDYVVKDGEVLIVDEFTGRIMFGRRYNEGLHQAIEAKEGVTVARESKTLATITFQNYFRLYPKLSGMTGTALTEEAEFREIYGLGVIEIPTNKPVQRVDYNDSIYKTEKGKFEAVIRQIEECHAKGQPVLVGTITIDKSELLSSMLKKRGIKHNVLNAKFHEQEAYIVAQAGKYGAVTIATNMAGRGTDIKLGGNAEFLAKDYLRKQGFTEEQIVEADGFGDTEDPEILEARRVFKEKKAQYDVEIAKEEEKVKEAGGLYIIGTERHESRRIDNQLRGRSGRQGDPGASRFFISLEDDLMRLFGGDRVQSLMNVLNIEEDQPIETKVLTNTIESAQRKVESRNFEIRKSVLQYDDVLNKQREIIYKQRNIVLDDGDIHEYILKMIDEMIRSTVRNYCPEDDITDNWNTEGLRDVFLNFLTTENDFHYKDAEEKAEQSVESIVKLLRSRAQKLYDYRESIVGTERMRELERVVLLKTVDRYWMEHIDNMTELKRGIHLRAYAQKNPVTEYQIEGFQMFDEMIDTIRDETVRLLLTMRIQMTTKIQREQVAKPTGESHGDEEPQKKRRVPIRVVKTGRNDPYSCGSGKK